jgi:hypothetical protein
MVKPVVKLNCKNSHNKYFKCAIERRCKLIKLHSVFGGWMDGRVSLYGTLVEQYSKKTVILPATISIWTDLGLNQRLRDERLATILLNHGTAIKRTGLYD